MSVIIERVVTLEKGGFLVVWRKEEEALRHNTYTPTRPDNPAEWVQKEIVEKFLKDRD